MKYHFYLLGLALLVVGTMPAFSQVSNDNEDEVYKIDARARQNDFVPGQVLVKFKDESPVNVSRTRGMFRSVDNWAVDEVLKEFEVESMDKLLPNAKPLQTRRKTRAFNGEMIEEKDLSQIYILKTKSLRKDSTMQLVNKLKEIGEVEYVEPNYKVYIMGQAPNFPAPQKYSQQRARTRAYTTETTDDVICADPSGNPLYSEQWGIEFEGLPELWKKPIINKKRPVIAILDTGVDITHPDLVDNIWTKPGTDNEHGYDFINNTTEIRDYNSHGTHVAGIAAASNNETGVIGANPQALIMPVTVMQSDGTGDVATIAKGVDYAIENGATIINMSLGSYANSNTLRQSLGKAYQTAVIVAGAGNDSKGIYTECSHTTFSALNDMVFYPAGYEFVLGVQALTKSGDLALWSNYDCDGPTFSLPGKDIWSNSEGCVNYEIIAPGSSIISTFPDGNYKSLNGTSMAAPLLAGGISVLQMIKEYNSQEILWGDIIHSSNLLKAYDVTERPAMLELVSLVWDDATDGGNGDGKPDAGETLRLYPIIKTTWGEAHNIKMNLSVSENEDASLVDIQSSNVDFGWNLSNYAQETSKNPIVIRVADGVSDSRHIRLLLTATCEGSQRDISYDFPIVVNNIVKIGGVISSDMTLTPDKNYLVANNLLISEGVSFVVEPGTTLKFSDKMGISNQGNMKIKGTPEKPIVMTTASGASSWYFIEGKIETNQYGHFVGILDTLEYCRIENAEGSNGTIYCKNCIFSHCIGWATSARHIPYSDMFRCNVVDGQSIHLQDVDINLRSLKEGKSNFVNNGIAHSYLPWYERFGNVNYFNNFSANMEGELFDQFSFDEYSSTSDLSKPVLPSYLGTSREDIANSFIRDIDFGYGFKQADLSTLLKEPIKEAHGIVWKVVVNGKDAQDEYEELDPLGVGKHKFEVYFNRSMNKMKIPQISFGVREPFTQNAVAEDASWNDEGTIYTAYVTITGKTQSDGVNRIYVYGAEDDEFFECPYEKTRLNVNIQSAGSQSAGFSGEAGLGRVELEWNELKTDMTDVLGFNVYRYTTTPEDSVRVNDVAIDAAETHFTDFDIVPGTTYYYKYKVQSTDLREYQPSNVVAVTPLTAKLGDVTGNNEVDVFDIVYEVNYILGQKPKAFVKCAADVNSDNVIDILDVQGIIKTILDPSAATRTRTEEAAPSAVYTIEDGVLYVESPVALGGVQVQVNVPENTDITTLDDLKGFEQAGSWLSKNDYRFLAYNMKGKTLTAGKHALLRIGDGQVTSIRLGDANAKSITVIAGEGTTGIDNMATAVKKQSGIYNLKGQKVAGSAEEFRNLPKGIYIIDGNKVLK